jgi:hypothetical protein
MILPELKGALEVAVLVRCMSNITDAAALIEQYGQTVASGAHLDRTIADFDAKLDRVRQEMAR